MTAALADYYEHATEGDLIKSHDAFAVFSKNDKWVGDLTTLKPGDGYFFQRLGKGDVNVRFYENNTSKAPKRSGDQQPAADSHWSNPAAATNMTMIVQIEGLEEEKTSGLHVFVNEELVGKATPLTIEEETYYFLTIQSDNSGAELRFQTEDGTPLQVINPSFGSEAAESGWSIGDSNPLP